MKIEGGLGSHHLIDNSNTNSYPTKGGLLHSGKPQKEKRRSKHIEDKRRQEASCTLKSFDSHMGQSNVANIHNGSNKQTRLV